MAFKKLLVSILFVLFLLPTQTFAGESNNSTPSITPDKKLLYAFKRIMEKSNGYIKFSKQSKLGYYKDLVNERFSELQYVVQNKKVSEVESSTQRLSFQIGTLTDFMLANKSALTNEKEEAAKKIISYKQPLESLRDYFPANSSYWMLVQHSINTLDLNVEKLK